MSEVADNTIVDRRYRILNRIGSGGMADVYVAEDTHLGRQVALKVLYRRYAQDAQFVERFRREAAAAAGLQHPNIVNVFDRGEHDGTYYIAMEMLRGRTLKDVIAADAPLPQERVIDTAIYILQAAGFGHRRGVVHRDFKPQNVIVSSDDEVKVTDFGIARSGTSEMTETGSIMGTAQYLSPEQAQGHSVTGASDLYSIGVILYEMLTGQVPFEGDTAVSIAVKHLNEPPPPISTLRPDVHPALEAVVMRALAKDPDQRYADAEEFISALQSARAAIESGEDGHDTTMWAPVAAPAPAEEDGEGPTSVAPAAVVAGPAPVEEERRRRWPLVLLGLLALAALAAGAWMLTRPDQVRVPDVVGDQLSEARRTLERRGFDVSVQRESDPAPADRVIDQKPRPCPRRGRCPAGRESDADEGSSVTLVVSSGLGQANVPSVEGQPERRAVKELNEACERLDEQDCFTVVIDRVPSNRVERGIAIRTVPAGGTRQDIGSRIRLFVSAGAEKAEVPDVVGLSRSSAESRLEAAGLGVVVDEVASGEPEGEVTAQDPDGGARVDQGTRVTLQVSRGPDGPADAETAPVPDVTGLGPGAARAELRSAGFGVEERQRRTDSRDEDGRVVSQRPRAGTELREGRTVVIFIGRFEEPPAPTPSPPPAQ